MADEDETTEAEPVVRCGQYHIAPGPESRWTPPRPDCPHPNRWSADDAESTEREVTDLVAAFVTALQPDYVIETGTAWGQTTEAIGRALKSNGQGRLETIETDKERLEFSLVRCHRLPVDFYLGSSMEFEPSTRVDFAWFDSECELRPEEFRRYYPWMHSSTVVGFHDTGPHKPTRAFIEPLEREGLLSPIYLPTPRGVCFARVNVKEG